MSMYIPQRDIRFEYTTEAVEDIEENNCSKGCRVPSPDSTDEFPSGDCPITMGILLEKPQVQIEDHVTRLVCTARQPLLEDLIAEEGTFNQDPLDFEDE